MVFQCMNPAHTNRIDREMNRLVATLFGETPQHSTGSRPFAVNIWENDEAWLLEAELPGVTPAQLDLSVIGDELTISVEAPETDEQDVTYFRRERPRGGRSRTVQLSAAIDAKRVEAALAHGVLSVTLPKSEAAQRRKIKVNAGN